MVLVPVPCPYCHSAHIIKGSKTETGKQRYRCQETDCLHSSSVLVRSRRGYWLASAARRKARTSCRKGSLL